MIPTSITTVILFFLLVAPGLLAGLLSARWKPTAKRTASQEAGKIVLWSTVYTILGAALVVWLFSLAGFGVDHLTRATTDETYRAEHLVVLGAELVSVTVAALLLVALADLARAALSFVSYVRAKYGKDRRSWKEFKLFPVLRDWRASRLIVERSMWYLALKDECPSEAVPVVRVALKSGQVFVGDVRSLDPDLGYDGREVALQQPLYVADGADLQRVHPTWGQILFASDAIDSITVRYEDELDVKRRPKPRWILEPALDGALPLPGSTSAKCQPPCSSSARRGLRWWLTHVSGRRQATG